jgi:hypothetical protein
MMLFVMSLALAELPYFVFHVSFLRLCKYIDATQTKAAHLVHYDNRNFALTTLNSETRTKFLSRPASLAFTPQAITMGLK